MAVREMFEVWLKQAWGARVCIKCQEYMAAHPEHTSEPELLNIGVVNAVRELGGDTTNGLNTDCLEILYNDWRAEQRELHQQLASQLHWGLRQLKGESLTDEQLLQLQAKFNEAVHQLPVPMPLIYLDRNIAGDTNNRVRMQLIQPLTWYLFNDMTPAFVIQKVVDNAANAEGNNSESAVTP